MDELPELPFEQVLSYLNLKDRLKARTVSKAWRNKFDSYPVKTLCYSMRPSDFIFEKSRWVSGAFAENFINSTNFTLFFDTFGQTILSGLKHLRFCDLNLLSHQYRSQHDFNCTLNSFNQLEKLDIIRVDFNWQEFNLPMLTSLQLKEVNAIRGLILIAPKLRDVKILDCSHLGLKIVHKESVERLLVNYRKNTKVNKLKKLKNLQYLYVNSLPWVDPTFVSNLQQLKEIHMNYFEDVFQLSELFEQKQRYNRADLKIYLKGLLLNGPDDPAMDDPAIDYLRYTSSEYLSKEWFVCLAENQFRFADVIPFYRYLSYSYIEGVAPGLEVNLLKRFIHLNFVEIYLPVQDIELFLHLLKNCIVELKFECDQPQDLFDRLPEYCAVQKLTINSVPSDLDFLFRLKHLIHLHLGWSIDSETVRRAFQELPVLSSFWFQYGQKRVSIETNHPKQFSIWVGDGYKAVTDLNAVIEFIVETEQTEEAQGEDLK